MDGEPIDLGRYEVVTLPEARGAFKTATLRDVARRPPYMHDGSLPTLAAVVAFLEALTGEIDPWLSRRPVLPPDP